MNQKIFVHALLYIQHIWNWTRNDLVRQYARPSSRSGQTAAWDSSYLHMDCNNIKDWCSVRITATLAFSVVYHCRRWRWTMQCATFIRSLPKSAYNIGHNLKLQMDPHYPPAQRTSQFSFVERSINQYMYIIYSSIMKYRFRCVPFYWTAHTSRLWFSSKCRFMGQFA